MKRRGTEATQDMGFINHVRCGPPSSDTARFNWWLAALTILRLRDFLFPPAKCWVLKAYSELATKMLSV